ncbi:MAG: hypothetical protein H7A41_04730 [Chlamydiales bacterium]|nr:hypothetical protein [Chlamydiales bacterium]
MSSSLSSLLGNSDPANPRVVQIVALTAINHAGQSIHSAIIYETTSETIAPKDYQYQIISGNMEGKSKEDTVKFLISKIDEISHKTKMEAWIRPGPGKYKNTPFHFVAACYPTHALSHLCELLRKGNLLKEALGSKNACMQTPYDVATEHHKELSAFYLRDLEETFKG